MIEVYNLDGMPVCKYRSEANDAGVISELEARGLPSGVYFVKMMSRGNVRTSKLTVM